MSLSGASWPPLGDVGFTVLAPPCLPHRCCMACRLAHLRVEVGAARRWRGVPA